MSPKEFEKAELSSLATVFRTIIARGSAASDLISLLRDDLDSDTPIFNRRQIAKMLMQSGNSIEAGEFLPAVAEATGENDYEALNLLSTHFLAVYAKDKKTDDLEHAWNVTQAILASEGVDKDERKQALARAVQLASEVKAGLGKKWLDESFIDRPERGLEVLGSIGSDVSRSLLRYATSPDSRLEGLKLQQQAVAALFEASPDRAKEWKDALELLAQNWLREALVSYQDDNSSSLGPAMNRDVYGNIFYYDPFEAQRRNQLANARLRPIPTGKLLDVKPGEKWLALIDDALRPKFSMIQAQLYLKVAEEEKALPFIEDVSEKYPLQTVELVKEFLRVWSRNHNPNSKQQRTNTYMFMYGFESRAQSIPLTRSKQQRNLRELADLIPRLSKLSTEELDQDLLLQAFFTCHSTAEVYQSKQIEEIFGKIENVKPEIIAKLAQRMRSNLAQSWRDANVQKTAKTKRRKKDIEKEVLQGYAVAREVLNDAMNRHPDNWALLSVDAALLHDENNYQSELANTSEFSPRRNQAMTSFQKASEKYIAKISEMEEKDYTVDAFTTWFYACLGACDLNLIEENHVVDDRQPKLIRAAIERLPEDAAEWHMRSFANLLFNRMSTVKPELKHKYLDAGFKIVGDHPQAEEARRVHEYYKDLVTEIKLETKVDGDARVGTEPFGFYVNLVHTAEIERESGGFGRYLQNQNNTAMFAYNYGRPTENYRDKFDEFVRDALKEHFQVMSVTFQTPDVKSAPSGSRPGWRVTPYAYVLAKARGPEVDQIPSIKLDLDFLDTSGYAILPVESPQLPISAKERLQEPRPHRDLQITQILDERQAEDGKLVLEIKAQSQGLVPDLNQIMQINPNKFNVTEIDDQGVSVSRFDELSSNNKIISERNWLVSLEADKGLIERPKSFDFPVPTIETNELVYQRYVDADLETVGASLTLEEKYVKPDYWMMSLVIGLVVLGIILLGVMFYVLSQNSQRREPDGPRISDNPNPFTAITVLKNIQVNNGLSSQKKEELSQSINRLEEYYFGQKQDGPEPDLPSIVRKWTKRARIRTS